MGDLRRLLIKEKDLNQSIKKFINKSFFYIHTNIKCSNYNSIYNKFRSNINSRNISHLLILNKNKTLNRIIEISEIINDLKYKNICIVGLGHVGLPLLVHIAKRNIAVTGYDISIKKIKELKKNKISFYEKNLANELKILKKKNIISFENNIKKNKSQIYIICLGTEIKNKKISNQNIYNVIKKILKVVSNEDIIILRGTVPVGFTRNLFNTIKYKTKNIFYLGYCPERIIEGNALEELENLPQVVSAIENKSLNKILYVCNQLFNKVIIADSLEEAEILKLSSNVHRDLSFSFSNEISRIAKYYNIESRKLIEKLNSGYPRNNISLPSPGVGGSCLAKDATIFSNKIKNKKGYKLGLIARNINKNSIIDIKNDINILKKIQKVLSFKILICGITFKGVPETSDIRSSTAIDLFNLIKKDNVVKMYDLTLENFKIFPTEYKNNRILNTNKIQNFDLIFFMNNNPNYFDFLKKKLTHNRTKKNKHIFDYWGIINLEYVHGLNYKYHTLSKNY